MSSSPEVRSDKILVSQGGQPIVHGSGLLDLVTAVSEQAGLYVPFDATIVSIRSRVRVACGTAAGDALLGSVKNADADYFGVQAHDTTDAAGTEFEWTIINADVDAGDVIYFSGDGGATSTGSCDVTVTLSPRV